MPLRAVCASYSPSFWECKQNSFLYLFIYANPVRFSPGPFPPGPSSFSENASRKHFLLPQVENSCCIHKGAHEGAFDCCFVWVWVWVSQSLHLLSYCCQHLRELWIMQRGSCLASCSGPPRPVGLSKHNTQYVHCVALRDLCQIKSLIKISNVILV